MRTKHVLRSRLQVPGLHSLLLTLLLAAGCGGNGGEDRAGGSAPTPHSPPAEPRLDVGVGVVVTTNDQAMRMAARPDIAFSAPEASAGNANPIDENTIVIDETRRYQTVAGFGAAFTDSSTWLLNRIATPAAREEAMNSLFTRNGNGIGLSAMRTTIGSSDMSRFHYTYDDMPPGQTDPALANFSIAVDEPDRIPVIQWAKRLNPDMLLLASAWSAPAWMKTNDSLYGGDLRPSAWAAWANYYLKYLQAYESKGIGIDLISHQNEPDYASIDYPGMQTNPETQRLLLRDYILPSLETSNLDTRVLVFDHNWDNTTFPIRVLTDSRIGDSARVAGTGWHWYGGSPGAMTVLHNLFPDKENHVTEAASGAWIADPVTNDFEMIIQSMRNWSSSFIKWALVLDENRGPHLGGCDRCTPVVTINSMTGALSYEIDYYTLGHFSKYVLPGATRIYSTNPTGMVSVAFQNPDGSKALIAFNDTGADKDFQLVWGRQIARYTLPPYSGGTFTWSGVQSQTYPIPATTKIQSSSYDDVFALQTETTSDADGGYNLGFSINDSYARYNNIDFGAGVTSVEARVSNSTGGRNGSTIEFHLDSPGGQLIATVPVPDVGGFQNWSTVSSPVSVPVTGVHDVYIVFKSNGSAGNVNWFDFA